jgi:hypothetical protein
MSHAPVSDMSGDCARSIQLEFIFENSENYMNGDFRVEENGGWQRTQPRTNVGVVSNRHIASDSIVTATPHQSRVKRMTGGVGLKGLKCMQRRRGRTRRDIRRRRRSRGRWIWQEVVVMVMMVEVVVVVVVEVVMVVVVVATNESASRLVHRTCERPCTHPC